MAERILVPTDGSKSARRAAEQAVELAGRDDAEIHALYVMNMGDLDFAAVPGDIAETRERLERKGTEFVRAVADLAEAADVPVETDVRTGIPEEAIAEYATDHDVDLVVMGKKGRSDPDKSLAGVGSTTRRVVGLTDVPVRVV